MISAWKGKTISDNGFWLRLSRNLAVFPLGLGYLPLVLIMCVRVQMHGVLDVPLVSVMALLKDPPTLFV
jgi:hypothetical protein